MRGKCFENSQVGCRLWFMFHTTETNCLCALIPLQTEADISVWMGYRNGEEWIVSAQRIQLFWA